MDPPHLVLPVLDGGDPEGGLVGEHETARGQPLVPRIQHSVQHGLVEQAVAHPLRDDDVHLNRIHGQFPFRTIGLCGSAI